MWAQLGAMLTQLGAMLAYLEGYVGRSWGLCRPILRPMLAHVDPCGAKRSEKWEQQKNTVKRRIFWGSAAYLGAMLAHLGGYVGPSWGYVGPSWSYDGPSWGYLSPSWALGWPILGLCWPILRPMLAHVDPSWATRSEKWEKVGRAQNTVKRGSFWRPGVSAAGAAAPLSYGEERTAVRQGHGQGAPGRIFGLTPLVGSAGPLGPPFHRSVGVKVTEWGPASEIYSLGFLEHICWNRRFFGEQVSSRKLLRRVFPKELLPISTCYFV